MSFHCCIGPYPVRMTRSNGCLELGGRMDCSKELNGENSEKISSRVCIFLLRSFNRVTSQYKKLVYFSSSSFHFSTNATRCQLSIKKLSSGRRGNNNTGRLIDNKYYYIMDSTEQAMCASCGKAEVDEIKLKKCACKLVRYCGVECQKNHWSTHKKLCKERMAKIRDDRLFRQPDESHWGECPICCLPVPIDPNKSKINSCCGKPICNGCIFASELCELEQGRKHRCPYCRGPLPKTEEEMDENYENRAKANDPDALCGIGQKCRLEKDYDGAFQYYGKAAALGDMDAHLNLSVMYRRGDGVENSKKKELYHMEEAAVGGHPTARYWLGRHEWKAGRYDRATRHFIIAAKLGYDGGLEMVKRGFALGIVSKKDYQSTLR